MTPLLTADGKPYCFDVDDFYDATDGLDCEGCPVEYQEQMLRERRCFPPDPMVTPVRGLMEAIPDLINLRAVLAQIRIGSPVDKLDPKPRYLR